MGCATGLALLVPLAFWSGYTVSSTPNRLWYPEWSWPVDYGWKITARKSNKSQAIASTVLIVVVDDLKLIQKISFELADHGEMWRLELVI